MKANEPFDNCISYWTGALGSPREKREVRCAAGGLSTERRSAAKPARSRHCNGEPLRERHWVTGKARGGEDPEPGDLPVRARTVTFG